MGLERTEGFFVAKGGVGKYVDTHPYLSSTYTVITLFYIVHNLTIYHSKTVLVGMWHGFDVIRPHWKSLHGAAFYTNHWKIQV